MLLCKNVMQTTFSQHKNSYIKIIQINRANDSA